MVVNATESGDFALFHDPLHHALLPVLLDALRVRLSPRADGLALLFWVRVGHGFSLLGVSEIQSARFCTRGGKQPTPTGVIGHNQERSAERMHSTAAAVGTTPFAMLAQRHAGVVPSTAEGYSARLTINIVTSARKGVSSCFTQPTNSKLAIS